MNEVRVSPIESEHFGVCIARVEVDHDDSPHDLVRSGRSQGVDLLVARCDAGDIATARRLGRHGFDLADTVVRYAFDLVGTDVPEVETDATIHHGTPDDVEVVGEIATEAFQDRVGHLQADERLDRDAAWSLYPTWARASCLAADSPDEVVILAARDAQVVGFVTGRFFEGKEAVGLLAGVRHGHRRDGIYRALLASRLIEFRDRGAARSVVATQLPHLASQYAWLQLGYQPAGSQYTFHLWLD